MAQDVTLTAVFTAVDVKPWIRATLAVDKPGRGPCLRHGREVLLGPTITLLPPLLLIEDPLTVFRRQSFPCCSPLHLLSANQ